MKHPLLILLACLLSACHTPLPLPLGDYDVIPTGSKVEFWVDHDTGGWRKSNIFIAMLPRPMTGLEARRWAEGTGSRDAGLLWTRYYLVASPEATPKRRVQYVSPVYVRNHLR